MSNKTKREHIGGPEHMRQLAIKRIQDAANETILDFLYTVPRDFVSKKQAEMAYYACKGDEELSHRVLTEVLSETQLREMELEVERRFIKSVIREVLFEEKVREANRRRSEDEAYTKIPAQELEDEFQ